METIPQLGDSLRVCSHRLGQPTWRQALDGNAGLLVQQYPSRLGPLTILFAQERSVAFHLRYATPRPQTAALSVAVAQLAAGSGGTPRLLIDDAGWLLVALDCADAAVQAFARAVLSPERQAQLAAWEQTQLDQATTAP